MGELYLPVRLAEAVREERAAAMQARQIGPLMVQPGVPVAGSLGSQPSKNTLLKQIKGWAAIAARPIADRVQDLELEAYEKVRGGGEVVYESRPDSVLQDILDNPGPLFTKQLLLRVTVYHLLFAGESWWQKVVNGFDATRELWPLPTQNCDPIYAPDGALAGARIVDSFSRTQFVPAEELVRIWTPDPYTLATSIGVLGPQAEEWSAQRALVGVQKSHFESGAVPSVALKAGVGAAPPPGGATGNGASDDSGQAESFAEYWSDRYNMHSGTMRGVPAFLPPGFDVVEFQQHKSIVDLNTVDDHYARQFLAAYGVPGSIVGEDKEVNRATAEANQYTFDVHTVKPITSLMSGAITEQLARDFGDWGVRFKPFVAPDKEFDLREEAQDLALKVRTINEVRAKRDELDESDWGEEPVGTTADVPYRPDDAYDALLGVSEPASEPRGDFFPVKRREPSEIQARQDVAVEREQRTYARKVRGLFETQRRETLKRYREATQGRDDLERVSVDEIFNPLEWLDLFVQRLYPQRSRVFRDEAEATAADISGADFNFTEANAEAIVTDQLVSAGAIGRTTQGRLDKILRKAIEQGLGAATVARQISGMFRDRARANTVARTEIGAAFTGGQLAGAEASGVVTRKVWNTSEDERVRSSHVALNEEAVTLTENFNVGGSAGSGPRDPALPIGERANCRCFLTFETE